MTLNNFSHLIIFDLDGTLYSFDNGNSANFRSSKFYSAIKTKIYSFLSDRLKIDDKRARELYEEVKKEFNGEVSLGLEKKFGIDRYEYFNNTWNLSPSDFIEKNNLEPLIGSLGCEIAILTSAPRVWASAALDYLNLSKYKCNLFSGEPDLRKPDPRAFQIICDGLGYEIENSISIGDQVHSDIVPAKSLGMKTILIREKSEEADYCISSINELSEIIERIKRS
jgi:FMN phosphatase YigB (HAD superfamily)